jgi:antitoxin (DNA-binding transcriptional repressor) of toxin-antitoxin stability system
MATSISATQAAREFSSVLTRVRFRGEEFVIEKGGEPMCRILPLPGILPGSTAAELASIVGRFPKPDSNYLKQVERAVRNQPKVPKSTWER